MNSFDFDRCLKPSNAIEDPELTFFCDASRLSFGTCSYIRWKLADGKFTVRFIAAKTRVSPLKELSIPRLDCKLQFLRVDWQKLSTKYHDLRF